MLDDIRIVAVTSKKKKNRRARTGVYLVYAGVVGMMSVRGDARPVWLRCHKDESGMLPWPRFR